MPSHQPVQIDEVPQRVKDAFAGLGACCAFANSWHGSNSVVGLERGEGVRDFLAWPVEQEKTKSDMTNRDAGVLPESGGGIRCRFARGWCVFRSTS